MSQASTGSYADVVSELAHGGWRAPEFWVTVAALVGGAVCVAWPGFTPTVKAAEGVVAGIVALVYTGGRHKVRATAVRTLPDVDPASSPAMPPVPTGPPDLTASVAQLIDALKTAPASPSKPGGTA